MIFSVIVVLFKNFERIHKKVKFCQNLISRVLKIWRIFRMKPEDIFKFRESQNFSLVKFSSFKV